MNSMNVDETAASKVVKDDEINPRADDKSSAVRAPSIVSMMLSTAAASTTAGGDTVSKSSVSDILP